MVPGWANHRKRVVCLTVKHCLDCGKYSAGGQTRRTPRTRARVSVGIEVGALARCAPFDREQIAVAMTKGKCLQRCLPWRADLQVGSLQLSAHFDHRAYPRRSFGMHLARKMVHVAPV